MINVYDGTLGSMFDNHKMVTELTTYLINNNTPLNYEIMDTDKVKVVCILGINDIEKALPNFSHPIIFNFRNYEVIAVDFRLFVKQSVNENVINISDVLQDVYNGKLTMYRTIFTRLLLSEDVGFLLSINALLAETFAAIFTTVINSLVLDKNVIDSVLVSSLIHYYTMNDVVTGTTSISEIVRRLPVQEVSKLLSGNMNETYNALVALVNDHKFIVPSCTIGDLVNNIKVLSNSHRLKGINSDILIDSISRMFYSTNTKQMTIAMIESKPTLITIVYLVLTEGVNANSTMKKIIMGRAVMTKPKQIIETLKQVLAENINRM